MSTITDIYDDELQDRYGSPLPPIHTARANEVDETAIRANRRVSTIFRQLAPPSSGMPLTDRALPVEELAAQNERLEALVENLEAKKNILENQEAPHTLDFPNLAWESVKAGLAKEKLVNSELNKHIAQAEMHQKDIDLLLEFSAKLTAHKEGTEMSPEMLQLLDQLKTRGIDLWQGDEKELSKEKISELKSLSSSHVDKLRSNLQIIFTTKIQTLIQSIGSIMEILKDIIRNNTKLINAANRLPGH